MSKKMSWMDIELRDAIIEVLDPTISQKNKKEVLDVISRLIIKRYKGNIKKYKLERTKWMEDNWKENAKDLINQ